MSIVACVKVHDGITMGADSATQVTGRDSQGRVAVFKIYKNSKKIFDLQDSSIGILTYGIGNIGKKSIQTLLRDFDKEHPYGKSNYTVEAIVKDLYEFFKEVYEDQYKDLKIELKPILGFFIAGYSKDQPLGEEWEFIIPKQEYKQVRPPDQFGSSWRGVSVPFTRLYFGFDPRAKEELAKKTGAKKEIIDKTLDQFKSNVIYDGMPVKDALQFVEFILKTTIGLASFEIGAESCSEPIHTAVIDPEKGFQWIKKPELS